MSNMMLFRTFVLLQLCVYVWTKKTYDGYQTYRLHVNSTDQYEVVNQFDGSPDFDFWVKTKILGRAIDVMVAPESQREFLSTLEQHGIEYSVYIQDIQQYLYKNEQARHKVVRDGSKLIEFNKFYSYEEISTYLATLAEKHPNLVKVESYGQSYENRSLNVIIISSGGGGKKPSVLLEAGIHGREWTAPATALYLIHQLVEKYEENKDLLENTDWIIVPVTNPDGYEYSRHEERFWRKNRQLSKNGSCVGTDGNRNFDFHWEDGDNSCSDGHRGDAPHSAPEVASMVSLENRFLSQIKAYIAFHMAANVLLYPYSHEANALPEDWKDLHALGEEASVAIEKIRGNKYEVGNSYELLGISPGCSDDYNKGVLKVKYSYTFEGYGGDGFETPPEQLQAVVEEHFAGLRVIGLKVGQFNLNDK